MYPGREEYSGLRLAVSQSRGVSNKQNTTKHTDTQTHTCVIFGNNSLLITDQGASLWPKEANEVYI